MADEKNGATSAPVYVTRGGLPLMIDLKWPFHRSGSGADFWVLHADIRLGNSEGLHALVAVNLTATVREVLPSLEPQDAGAPVLAALRKEVDHRQLEFLKSGKLVPVQFSSRYYDFKRNKWVFGQAGDEEISLLIARKVFWQTKLSGGNTWVGDPAEAVYVENSVARLLELARGLAESGLMTLQGEWASANASLMAQAEKFEADMRSALTDLEKKHAFEDGRKKVS
jgi:hypothetical protein